MRSSFFKQSTSIIHTKLLYKYSGYIRGDRKTFSGLDLVDIILESE